MTWLACYYTSVHFLIDDPHYVPVYFSTNSVHSSLPLLHFCVALNFSLMYSPVQLHEINYFSNCFNIFTYLSPHIIICVLVIITVYCHVTWTLLKYYMYMYMHCMLMRHYMAHCMLIRHYLAHCKLIRHYMAWVEIRYALFYSDNCYGYWYVMSS